MIERDPKLIACEEVIIAQTDIDQTSTGLIDEASQNHLQLVHSVAAPVAETPQSHLRLVHSVDVPEAPSVEPTSASRRSGQWLGMHALTRFMDIVAVPFEALSSRTPAAHHSADTEHYRRGV